MLRKARIAIAVTSLFIIAPTASAQPTVSEQPVTTIVVIQTPAGVTRAALEAGFRQAVPLYEKIPGLMQKYFIANNDSFGGMYLWKDRASADAWFTPAWRAKAKATYGSEAQLTYFDSPVQIDIRAKAEAK